MDATRFDRLSKALGRRRVSRRAALAQGGAGLATAALAATGLAAATSAQDATPESAAEAGDHGPTMLFVQTFQSGTVSPKEGAAGRYTLTLEAGSGQTIYFSDRPDRIVGAAPTAQFLEGLGFPADNPPNAALVLETAPGETDVAVVELFNPLYDPVTQGVTYEVEVLANWEDSLEMGFHEAPTDLAAVAPTFGAAHLFIDDCPDGNVYCYHDNDFVGTIPNVGSTGFCYSGSAWACLPCEPWFDGNIGRTVAYFSGRCNVLYPECNGTCYAQHICTAALNCPT